MNEQTDKFPTQLHQEVAETARGFFGSKLEVDTVLLVNSCARGQATPQSDVDLAVLVRPEIAQAQTDALEEQWWQFCITHPVIAAFQQNGRFAAVHVDLFDGRYTPPVWDDGGGPDDFEVAIGNQIAYAVPLGQAGPGFIQLQATWLPYYDAELREKRLAMVREACLHDLDYVPFLLARALYFQAFDRLYKAYREFLQLLFIKRQQYPLAYNKWIYEQVVINLGLDDLYPQLSAVLSVGKLGGAELEEKSRLLRKLVDSCG